MGTNPMEEDFKRNAAVLSGVAALLRVKAKSNEYRDDSEIHRRALGEQSQLEDFLEKKVIEILGADYTVGPMEITEGSVIIQFLILTRGVVVFEKGEYLQFLKRFSSGVDRVLEAVDDYIAGREWARGSVNVKSSWRLGEAFDAANERLLDNGDTNEEQLLRYKRAMTQRFQMMWMMWRDLILLALLLWLLLRHKLL